MSNSADTRVIAATCAVGAVAGSEIAASRSRKARSAASSCPHRSSDRPATASA
jgi:hypothetical protein